MAVPPSSPLQLQADHEEVAALTSTRLTFVKELVTLKTSSVDWLTNMYFEHMIVFEYLLLLHSHYDIIIGSVDIYLHV